MADELEVIAINRITDAIDGDLIYQIQFGKLVDTEEGKEPMMPAPGGPVRMKQQITVSLVLNTKFKGPVPYRVGSKWRFEQEKTGGITLKEVKA